MKSQEPEKTDMRTFYLSILVTILSINLTAYCQTATLDPTFNAGLGTDEGNIRIQKQADEKVFIYGYFPQFNGTAVKSIVRLNPNGSIDPSFIQNTSNNGGINSLAIQDDGRIILVGNFSTYNSKTAARIVRLLPDGRVDSTFKTGSGFGAATIYDVAVQKDGKILVAGSFSSYNDTSAYSGLIRLHPTGAIDTTFKSYRNLDIVHKVKILSSNKIIVAGPNVTYYGDTLRPKLMRLSNEGELDNSFITGFYWDEKGFSIGEIAEQADGKIVVVGSIKNYKLLDDWKSVNNIIRINDDGKIDTTLKVGIGPNSYINSINIINNKMLVCGDFNQFSEIACGGVALIDFNGEVDLTFNAGNGANDYVKDAELMEDGKIILSGNFSEFNEHQINSVVRINGLADVVTSLINIVNLDNTIVYPNPTKENLTIELDNLQEATISVLNIEGKEIYKLNIANENIASFSMAKFNTGIYFIKIQSRSEQKIVKIIKQ